MSLLFTVESKSVIPSTEVLLIPPFSKIWERDKSITKENAIEDFCYIEFMVSVQKSNPYSGYHSDVRKIKIMQDVITRPKWKEDKLIVQGMEKLVQFQKEASVTYNYYISAKLAAEKMQSFFEAFDLNATNDKGFLLYKPRDITSALNDTSKVLENLSSLRDKVDNELFEAVKNKGQKIISPFASPSSL